MVVKHQAPAEAFAYQQGSATSGNMMGTPEVVYSYSECIARQTYRGIELNTKKYSVTTSAHQGAVRRAIEARGYRPDPLQPEGLEDGWVLYTREYRS